MTEHLPILQVILPLLAAPTCLILFNHRWVWLFALVIGAVSLVISALLVQEVVSNGTISYMLGAWEAPWGIEYRIDLLNAFVLLIVSFFGFVALLPAYKSISRELEGAKQIYFYTLYLLCFAGLLGIVATGDAFNIFVFLEISSLSTYALISLGSDRRALWASYQYLVMGTIGASFILIGIGFLYIQTGTLNIADLAERLPAVEDSKTVLAALAFIMVGICMKLAMFPLHKWLPNAYTYAPSIVTVFVAATATKVAVYLLIRFIFSIFHKNFSVEALPLQTLFLTLGLAGVYMASLVAINQTNIKKMFAYSSVAQIGYMIVGMGFGTVLGLQATLLHMFNHSLMKGAIFVALAAVLYQVGKTDIDSFKGLGRRMPITMMGIVLAGLSLIGVPLTAGFVSKWYLVMAALDANLWPIAAMIVVGSMFTVIYIWRLIETAYFQKPEVEVPRQEAPAIFLVVLWGLVLANIYFGVDTRLSVSVSGMAAEYLFNIDGVGQ